MYRKRYENTRPIARETSKIHVLHGYLPIADKPESWIFLELLTTDDLIRKYHDKNMEESADKGQADE